MIAEVVITNRSTLVSASDAALMTSAVDAQVRSDWAPLWGRVAPKVRIGPPGEQLPSTSSRIVLLDDSDQAGALGYHAQREDGRPYGRVFARGLSAIHGADSVSCCLSHEVLEMVLDPECNLWADSPDGEAWALEACDAVEQLTYQHGGVALSDFVLPAFFDYAPQAGARFDYLGKLSAPFTLAPGGYTIVRKDGKEQTRFGSRRSELGPRKRHPASRTSRRVVVGAA